MPGSPSSSGISLGLNGDRLTVIPPEVRVVYWAPGASMLVPPSMPPAPLLEELIIAVGVK